MPRLRNGPQAAIGVEVALQPSRPRLSRPPGRRRGLWARMQADRGGRQLADRDPWHRHQVGAHFQPIKLKRVSSRPPCAARVTTKSPANGMPPKHRV